MQPLLFHWRVLFMLDVKESVATILLTSFAFLLASLSSSFPVGCRVSPGYRSRRGHLLRQLSWTPIWSSSPGLREHFLSLIACSNVLSGIFRRRDDRRLYPFAVSPPMKVTAVAAARFVPFLVEEVWVFQHTCPDYLFATIACMSQPHYLFELLFPIYILKVPYKTLGNSR